MSRPWRTRKPSRPLACLALALTCALLSAGFFSHGHEDEDGHAGADGHHCAICCFQHHFSVTTTAAPAPVAPDPAAYAADSNRQRSGWDAARHTQATRGPPA